MKTSINIYTLIFFFFSIAELDAAILEVGPGKPYATPALASRDVQPGDTILIFPASYNNTNRIADLHGLPDQWIYFIGVDRNSVLFENATQSFHFSNVSYIHIESITISRQSANGMNIDDGGTFDTPTHHIRIVNCTFRDMASSGNNDLLKMSGVDYFWIDQCNFFNGAQGGSGIDMVGCHRGEISRSMFENMGSNAIQAKGGTQHITITQNLFKNAGQRSLNLGGSTGLAFFRPQDAPFEAADLEVFYNVFVGSTAPIAYVGCTRVTVANNTIVNPERWVVRILQETVDTSRFIACSYNSFINNIVYHHNNLSRHVNIGPNTLPQTFTFSHNLWYNHQSPSNSTPDLPVTEPFRIVGLDPLLENFAEDDFSISPGSPAIDQGLETVYNVDFYGQPVPSGPGYDMGAAEFQVSSARPQGSTMSRLVKVYPQPVTSDVFLEVHNGLRQEKFQLLSLQGIIIDEFVVQDGFFQYTLPAKISSGIYLIKNDNTITKIVVIK